MTEAKGATVILADDRYVGCYYMVEYSKEMWIRAYNRAGETHLFDNYDSFYAWLGIPAPGDEVVVHGGVISFPYKATADGEARYKAEFDKILGNN